MLPWLFITSAVGMSNSLNTRVQMYYKDRVDTHVAVVVMYKYSKSICIYLLSEMFNSPADGGCNISRLSVSNFLYVTVKPDTMSIQ